VTLSLHLLGGLMLKTIVLLMLSTFALSSGASGCHAKRNAALPTQTPNQETSTSAIKVLAEGFHSSVTHPFVAVVRDPETYTELLKLDANLPKLDSVFFRSNAVVAAFLGERNTGGYGVEVVQSAVGVRVLEKKPAKGVMVPQMITSPFKVIALEGVSNSPVWLALDDTWRKSLPLYRITSGRFSMSGGFAGASEKFGLQGAIRVIREGDVATFEFRLAGGEGMKKRALNEYATGSVAGDGTITLNKMSADSLINKPNSGLKATGALSRKDNKLSLTFISLPLMIADGYTGQGKIEADLETPLIKDKPIYE